ncbi:TPA: tail fiber domain-containing protein [Klebsiella pneumoniae]|nr:tail fiber domain-containing protein [Klebsiella pneumoniae]
MTVSTEVDHNDYTGNGVTTSFPYTFRIFKKSDLTVQVADPNENITVLTLDTDYSVTGAGTYSGGNVVLTSPLANGWQISISRNLPVTQETDLRNQGKFFAEVHEDAFDKLTMLIQQCFGFLRLALRKPSFIANYYDALNNRIRNLRDPSQAQDASTKNYVDEQIYQTDLSWQQGDVILDQKINSNFSKTIRVPESSVEELYPIEARKNSLFGWNSSGRPVPIFSMTETADLSVKLASLEPGLGGDLVGWKRYGLTSTINTVSRMLNAQPIFCYEYADLITDKPSTSDPTTWDWTPAINGAIAASKADRFQPVVLPHHAFITTGGHVITSNTPEFSGGSPSDGRKYKGVPIIGFGPEISKAKFKPASASSVCFSLVGNSGGHKTAAYLRDFSIEPESSAFQLLGYGIQYNCVNYARTDNVAVYMLNENFRLLNGISGGWTEFNSFTDCFSYRGNVCYSFVRTSGNDSFHGTQFTNCFGQIKKVGGGYGIKATGVSSSALVWVYNSKLDIKFYAGDAACKVFSLSFAEFTLNHGDLTCEGTTVMEALDDNSRVQHNGNWINNGATNYSVINELSGAQGRFVFRNAQSKSIAFSDSNFTGLTPYALRTTPESYSVNGAYSALFRGQGANFNSPFLASYDFSGNGLFIGRIGSGKSLSDFIPSWWLSHDGGIIQSYNSVFRFRVSGGTETYRVSSSSVYPNADNGMQLGLSTVRWSAAYFKQFSINDTGLVPTSAATLNIASSSSPVNNIYSQNSVTVVSDVTYKSDINELSEQEIKCAIQCGTLYRKYKLKSAIITKGAENARYHIGAIAQDVKDCFEKNGLDWRLYGVITYESWDEVIPQEAEYDEIGNIVKEEVAGQSAGEIYMLRYDEFNCFVMAGIIASLN